MSRTDELRKSGAKERSSGGGGTPFVKWGEGYAWLEGTVDEVWEGKYGDSATMQVTNHSLGLEVAGKTEEGEKYTVPLQKDVEINVGLNYAALKGAITKADKGKHFHIAFEGWAESKNGDKFRVFAVLEVPMAEDRAKPGENVPKYSKDEPWPEDERVPAVADEDDSLPF